MILRWPCRWVYQLVQGGYFPEKKKTTYHILAHLPRSILIDPFGETPVLLRDQPVLCGAADERGGEFLELRIKWLIIEENPVVVEF